MGSASLTLPVLPATLPTSPSETVGELFDRKLRTWRRANGDAARGWAVADARGRTLKDGLTYDAAKAWAEATVAAGRGPASIICPPRPLTLEGRP